MKIKKVMKSLVILVFDFFKLLPINNNVIFIDSWKGQGLRGNLLAVYKEIIKDGNYKVVLVGDNHKYSCKNTIVCRNKGIKHLYYLAVSKYWVVDTLYYDYFKPRKETKYILIWHAPGAFKRFGISTVKDSKENQEVYKSNGENLTHLIVSSEKVKQIYSEALCVDISKILALGLPRTDYYLEENNISLKNKVYDKYKISHDKKLLLYAPTFRGEGISKFELQINLKQFIEEFSSEYVLVIKLHPNNYMDEELITNEYIENVVFSKDDELEILMKASDCLITDYSSIIFEYSLMKKPIFFYAYDLDKYIEEERSFYVNYKEFVPGPIVYNTKELINSLKNYNINDYLMKIRTIADEYQIHDGRCTDRFIKYFFK